jgi:hypothetical protein
LLGCGDQPTGCIGMFKPSGMAGFKQTWQIPEMRVFGPMMDVDVPVMVLEESKGPPHGLKVRPIGDHYPDQYVGWVRFGSLRYVTCGDVTCENGLGVQGDMRNPEEVCVRHGIVS